jgi:preprotein translocase subunit YajC
MSEMFEKAVDSMVRKSKRKSKELLKPGDKVRITNSEIFGTIKEEEDGYYLVEEADGHTSWLDNDEVVKV